MSIVRVPSFAPPKLIRCWVTLTVCSGSETRRCFLSFSWDKKRSSDNQQGWEEFLWSLDVLALGVEPTFDARHQPCRNDRVGRPLVVAPDGKQWRGIAITYKGDLEYWRNEVRACKEVLRLPAIFI